MFGAEALLVLGMDSSNDERAPTSNELAAELRSVTAFLARIADDRSLLVGVPTPANSAHENGGRRCHRPPLRRVVRCHIGCPTGAAVVPAWSAARRGIAAPRFRGPRHPDLSGSWPGFPAAAPLAGCGGVSPAPGPCWPGTLPFSLRWLVLSRHCCRFGSLPPLPSRPGMIRNFLCISSVSADLLGRSGHI